jgi:putative hemolysin
MKSNPDPLAGLASMGDRILGRSSTAYQIRRVCGEGDGVERAQRLRFEVFNLELEEGLSTSYATGLDADPFDAVCEHLLVEEMSSGQVVGTYRMQTGRTAAGRLGYYSEQEFDLGRFEQARGEIIELGRACVDVKHRNLKVLSLLWKGIAEYAREQGARYLIGCSSLTSQDAGEGWRMYQHLAVRHLAPEDWRTEPHPALACGAGVTVEGVGMAPKVPRLLAAYLSIGARICGPPAMDREFGTIDFLTFLDVAALPMSIVNRYLR